MCLPRFGGPAMEGTVPERRPGQGNIERAAQAVELARANLVAALRKSDALVVLASLSLVIAAFAQSLSPEAVAYAASSSTAFLAAVLLSVAIELRTRRRPVTSIELGAAMIVAVASGFVMLGLVVVEFVNRYAVTGRIIVAILGSVTMVALATTVLGMRDWIREVRQGSPQTWARHRPYLRLSPWIATAAWFVLTATLVLFVFDLPYPRTIVAVGILVLLGPLVYVSHVRRRMAAAARA
jgi:hypothetical protein